VAYFACPTFGGPAKVNIEVSFSGNLVERKPYRINIAFSQVIITGKRS
jgi:hypothetical protein